MSSLSRFPQWSLFKSSHHLRMGPKNLKSSSWRIKNTKNYQRNQFHRFSPKMVWRWWNASQKSGRALSSLKSPHCRRYQFRQRTLQWKVYSNTNPPRIRTRRLPSKIQRIIQNMQTMCRWFLQSLQKLQFLLKSK